MKRFKLLAIALIIIFARAQAASSFNIGALHYIVSGSEVSVRAINTSIAGEITIPDTVQYGKQKYAVTSLYTSAFDDCSNITSVTIEAKITALPYKAFYDCSSLTSIIVPEGVTKIGNRALANCSALTEISLPSTLDSIDEYALYGVSKMERLLIHATEPPTIQGSSMPDIHYKKYIYVPYGCFAAYEKESNWSDLAYYFVKVEDGWNDGLLTYLPISDTTASVKPYLNAQKMKGKVIIPDSVSDILGSRYAITTLAGTFNEYTNITEVDIQAAIHSIPDKAFYKCYALEKVHLAEGVRSIGNRAFCNDTSLVQIDLPSTLTFIDEHGLNNIKNIEKIIIRATTPPELSSSSIANYTYREYIYVPFGTYSTYVTAWPDLKARIINMDKGWNDGTFTYTPLSATTVLIKPFLKKEAMSGEITIPDTVMDEIGNRYAVTSMPESAFNQYTLLTKVTIKANIDTIPKRAFWGCSSVTEMIVEGQVRALKERAICSMWSLTHLVLPSTLDTIGQYGIYNTAITTLEVNAETPPQVGPNGISLSKSNLYIVVPCHSLGAYADAPSWSSYKNNLYNVCEFEDDTFHYSLSSDGRWQIRPVRKSQMVGNIVMPTTATDALGNKHTITILEDDALRNCTAMTGLTLPAQLEKIGSYALRGCTGLSKITIPATVDAIMTAAFASNKFTKIVFTNQQPAVLGSLVFNNMPSSAEIVVPCGSIDAYQRSWTSVKDFIVEGCQDLIIYHHNTPGELQKEYEGGIVKHIEYKRHFIIGQWETLYLPFECDSITIYDEVDDETYEINDPWDIVDGGYFYLAELVDGAFQITEDRHLQGNKPYIIMFNDSYFANEITFTGTNTLDTIASEFEQVASTNNKMMAGNNTMMPQTIHNAYIMSESGNVFELQDNNILYPFECYVQPEQLSNPKQVRPRSFLINLNKGEQITTSLRESKITANELPYWINQGELVVLTAGQELRIHSIQGAEIAHFDDGNQQISIVLPNGVYILTSPKGSQQIIL
ncbi:MAG: leucine-rich repeat domain-containing protein [Paludibacteraceae bacterium]|nr:leucine-rich repeat domain-containing protein [Paludibacteraceae bacterium]